MKSYLIILALLIPTRPIKAQEESSLDRNTSTEDAIVQSDVEPVISQLNANEESLEPTKAPIKEQNNSDIVVSNRNEEKTVKRSPEPDTQKGENKEPKTGDDLVYKLGSDNAQSKLENPKDESKIDEKLGDVTPTYNQSTFNDNVKNGTDLSLEEGLRTGNIEEEHDADDESNMKNKEVQVNTDSIERSVIDGSNVNNSVGVKAKSRENTNSEYFVNSDGTLKATRRILFGHLDVIDAKARSGEDAAIDTVRAGHPVVSRVASHAAEALNKFGSRWNHPSDLVLSHGQSVTSPVVAYTPGFMRVQTATVNPQTLDQLWNNENNRVQFIQGLRNSRESFSDESRQIEYYKTLDSNAYPYEPNKKRKQNLPQSQSEAFSGFGDTTVFPKIPQFSVNFYKPYDSNYSAKTFNPYNLSKSGYLKYHYRNQPSLLQ